MKIFLDTASLDAIQYWSKTGLIDGVTTNPTHLSTQGGDPRKRVLDICAALPDSDISVEITEKDPQAVYKQAHELAALADNIVVKIPCHIDYYPIIKQLVEEGIRINITLLFSLPQALYMSKLGVDYISPIIGRLDDVGAQGIDLLSDIRTMLDTYGYETELLAASIRDIRHLHDAILAGVDVATVSPEVLEKSTHHLLTDCGIQIFERDWKKLGVKQFP